MTGLTKDAGWQLGIRRTLPVSPEELWDHLLGDGLPLWLGDTVLGDKGASFTTPDGGAGEIRGRQEGRKVRLVWRPAGADHETTIQVTVTPAASGATLGIHQERLLGPDERERMLVHWRSVIDAIAGLSPQVDPA